MTNISLGGRSSSPVPGATVSFRLACSNAGEVDATNIVFFDIVDLQTTYRTGTALTPSGWSNVEWSTLANPDQAWNSLDYTKVQPSVGSIRWIRWRRKSMPPGAKSDFSYKVIVR